MSPGIIGADDPFGISVSIEIPVCELCRIVQGILLIRKHLRFQENATGNHLAFDRAPL